MLLLQTLTNLHVRPRACKQDQAEQHPTDFYIWEYDIQANSNNSFILANGLLVHFGGWQRHAWRRLAQASGSRSSGWPLWRGDAWGFLNTWNFRKESRGPSSFAVSTSTIQYRMAEDGVDCSLPEASRKGNSAQCQTRLQDRSLASSTLPTEAGPSYTA